MLWVALGGALGSVLRALAGFVIPAGRLPWATIVVNVGGSLLIGWLMARFAPGGAAGEGSMRAQAFWVVGVCGGFTTFSTFSWQTIEQMQKGGWGAAAANVVLSVVLCLGATWAGWKIAQ
ncbi:MAG: CrcB family protein [Opitutaceae bacterium]|nr:CrcB family protein [Opitutaceae bacterium]